MARGSSERGGLAGLLDRLLGRRPEERTSESKPLFTAHQPPPAARAEPEEAAAPAGVEVPEEREDRAPMDLFRDRPPRRFPRDAWEEAPPAEEPEPWEVYEAEAEPEPVTEPEPEPVTEPEPEPEPGPVSVAEPEPEPEPEVEATATDGLQTSVNADLIERSARRSRSLPDVHVHDGHLEERSPRVELTPSQAIELARGGRDTLKRRDRD